MNQTQKELIELFKKLIDFLDGNNINYYCCSGTCLGAIRHKGFIPWDDDIDIFIKRNEYNKLLELSKTFMSDSCYFADINNKNYPCSFLKFYDRHNKYVDPFIKKKYRVNDNLFIDIFPIDYIGNDLNKCNKLVEKSIFIRRILTLKTTISKTIFKKMCGFFVKFTPIKVSFLKKKLNSFGVNFKSKYMMDICWGSKCFESSWFDNFDLVPFENILVKVPKEYDKYLTTIYGDYMVLPPEHKRINHSLIKVEEKIYE